MTREEAKSILLLYRPGTADMADPRVSEAMAFARQDPELDAWLENHVIMQNLMRAKFREIAAPAGLKEKIISELPSRGKVIALPRIFAQFAAAAAIAGLIVLAVFWFRPQRPNDLDFAIYQREMVGVALRNYAMDLASADPLKIRARLAQNQAPDFTLPAGMQNVPMTGCAIESFQGSKVSMICFNTGKNHLAPGSHSDVWLFVADSAAVQNVSAGSSPRFLKINRLMTASWIQDGKLYLLATESDENTVRELF